MAGWAYLDGLGAPMLHRRSIVPKPRIGKSAYDGMCNGLAPMASSSAADLCHLISPKQLVTEVGLRKIHGWL